MVYTRRSRRPSGAGYRSGRGAILAAAKEVFAQAGSDAPIEEVARAAGVGKGTLYSRFPTREHLFAAMLQERVDELNASAQRALGAPDVWRALEEWLGPCCCRSSAPAAQVGRRERGPGLLCANSMRVQFPRP